MKLDLPKLDLPILDDEPDGDLPVAVPRACPDCAEPLATPILAMAHHLETQHAAVERCGRCGLIAEAGTGGRPCQCKDGPRLRTPLHERYERP